jgi:hypothetical protein
MGKKLAHGLAQAAAGAVANDGGPGFPGGGEAGPGGRARLGPAARLDDNQAAALSGAICDKKELAARPQALNDDGLWISVVRPGFAQALRRLRPLARRRWSTRWPFLVAMRERKPCRRLRLRLLGWKVRLVDTGHAP